MYNKKPFIVFEGIEGSGKSFHSKNLIKSLKKEKIPYIYLREPGGTKLAEKIRSIILNNKSKKLDTVTDTLLYLAARNENVINNIAPYYNKKIIVCDRFTDSTIAYQHYGFGVDKKFINHINSLILKKIKPDFTFLMLIKTKVSVDRVIKRGNLNRYDKFKRNFYKKVQNGFLKQYKINPNKYMIVNSENSIKINKSIIYKKFKELIK